MHTHIWPINVMLRFPPILILWNYFSKRKVKDILGKCSTCLCTAPEKIILVAPHPSAALLHVLHIQTLNAQPFKPKSFSLSRLPNCGWNKAFINVTSNIYTAHKVCVHVVWSSTICVYRTVKWQRRIHAQLSLTNIKMCFLMAWTCNTGTINIDLLTLHIWILSVPKKQF